MSDRSSFLAVDTAIATEDTEVLQRLRSDPEWADHLEPDHRADVPAWVRALARSRSRRWVAPVLLAAAGGLMVAMWQGQDAPSMTAKGTPSLVLYVERDNRVTVWDGVTPLGAGDRFRVALADTGPFVLTYEAPGQPPAMLARGVEEGLLEGAWAFDGPARGAQLVVRAPGSDEPTVALALE